MGLKWFLLLGLVWAGPAKILHSNGLQVKYSKQKTCGMGKLRRVAEPLFHSYYFKYSAATIVKVTFLFWWKCLKSRGLRMGRNIFRLTSFPQRLGSGRLNHEQERRRQQIPRLAWNDK